MLIIYTYGLETGTYVIFTGIMCKVSRCNSTKLEAILPPFLSTPHIRFAQSQTTQSLTNLYKKYEHVQY